MNTGLGKNPSWERGSARTSSLLNNNLLNFNLLIYKMNTWDLWILTVIPSLKNVRLYDIIMLDLCAMTIF